MTYYEDAPGAWTEAALTGQVRSALRPLPDVMLTLTDRVGAQVTRTRTGADGRFLLTGLPPGSYVAIFSRTGYRPYAGMVVLDAAPAAPLDVVLDPSTSVRGFVRDRHDGEPVAAASVTAVGTDGEVMTSTVSDPDGGYHIAGIDAAELTLVVATPGADPVATPVRLDTDGTAEHHIDLTVDLRGALTGTITAGGLAVIGLALTLRDEHGRTAGAAVTDEYGTYLFDRVRPGPYTLHSDAGLPEVTTIAPATTTADVALPPQ